MPLDSDNPGDLWVRKGSAVTTEDFLAAIFPARIMELLAAKPNLIFSLACGSTWIDATSSKAWTAFAKR